MIVEELVEATWHGRNRKHFESLGYTWEGQNTKFKVSSTELNKGSSVIVNTICEFCNKIIPKPYCDYYHQTRGCTIENSCEGCQHNKSVKTWIKNYGVSNPNKTREVRKKIEKTNIERYGGISPMCSEDIQNKSKETNLEKYGVEHYSQTELHAQQLIEANMRNFGVPHTFQSKEIQEKSKKTNLEKYGVENYSQTEEYRINQEERWKNFKDSEEYFVWVNKIEQTNLKRYGVKSVFSSPEIREKALKTMCENNTVPTSSQQKHIHTLVGGELNYYFSKSALDIAFPEEKIYIEYDGGGHDLQVKLGTLTQEEFNKKEQRRSFFLKDNGWKEIRIISSKDRLPSDKDILYFIDIAKTLITKKKSSSIHWNIDEEYVKLSYKYYYTFKEFSDKFCDEKVVQ